jgi:hypothetical protein
LGNKPIRVCFKYSRTNIKIAKPERSYFPTLTYRMVLLSRQSNLAAVCHVKQNLKKFCSDIQNFKFHNNNLAKKYLSPFTGKKFHHLQLNL